MVIRHPSKLESSVRFWYPAPIFCRAIESISEALWALVDKSCLVSSFDAHRNPTQGSNNGWPRNIYPLCIFGSAAKHFVHLPRAEVRISLRLNIASRLYSNISNAQAMLWLKNRQGFQSPLYDSESLSDSFENGGITYPLNDSCRYKGVTLLVANH